jgi:hypothetical protein
MGDSVGHWDGDTFVVETTELNDATTLDEIGMPHTKSLKVIERFRRVSPDRLELKVTFDDPKAFTRSWSLPRYTLKLDAKATLVEFVCDNQRNPIDANGNISVELPTEHQ